MIYDKIENAGIYSGLGGRIARGLALLKEESVRMAEPGRYEVDGANLYYIVDQYETMPEEQGRFEAHRVYIDIQFIVSGQEWIGWREIEGMQILTPYDTKKDIEFYHRTDPITRVTMQAGTFAVLWPHEAHMPCRMFNKPERVKKIVIKVRVE